MHFLVVGWDSCQSQSIVLLEMVECDYRQENLEIRINRCNNKKIAIEDTDNQANLKTIDKHVCSHVHIHVNIHNTCGHSHIQVNNIQNA